MGEEGDAGGNGEEVVEVRVERSQEEDDEDGTA